MTSPAPLPPEEKIHNPWRNSLENCTDGSNYLRASEYFALIRYIDGLLGALQKIVDEGDFTAPEGMKIIAKAALGQAARP